MTIAQRLDAIKAAQEALIKLNDNNGKPFLKSIFSPDKLFLSMSEPRPVQEAREILDWFLDGGHIKTHRKVSTPYGERKNSKKRDTTQYFTAVKGYVQSQIGHITTQNYKDDFWRHAIKSIITPACDPEMFCYRNNSYINYVMASNPKVIDLGEEK